MTALDVVCTWIGRLWAGCALIVVLSVLLAVASEGLRKRRDVRQARRRGRGMWLEQDNPCDDWMALADAVQQVRDSNDDTLAEGFARWDAQLTEGPAA